MQIEADTPAGYRAAVPAHQRDLIERVRAAILAAAPDVVEGMAHGMLNYPGIASLGVQKDHVGLYVAPEVLARLRDRFPSVKCGKSCFRLRRVEQADPAALRALAEALVRRRDATASPP